MGWQDRDYHRDYERPGGGGPLAWILYGSVPLFTVFEIRVRIHAMLLILIGLVLVFGLGFGESAAARVQFLTVLFFVILLHEFGHCFAARYMGGEANDILMTPLGGLAMAMAPRRPWPTFVTVAGGPLVNVAICLICAISIYLIHGILLLGPWQFGQVFDPNPGWAQVSNYLFFFYGVSWFLLMFNLLPIFPLDGGQLLQSILWRPLGYYRSMLTAVTIGLVGAVLMVMVGLATFGTRGAGLLLIFIGIFCGLNCYRMRQMLKTEGPWGFSDEDEVDYSASLYGQEERPRRRRLSRLARWKARRLAQQEEAEQIEIDQILAKVSAHGMHSLTWWERRALRKATERQRQRDLEISGGKW